MKANTILNHIFRFFFVATLTFSLNTFAGNLADYPQLEDMLEQDGLVMTNFTGCQNDGYLLAKDDVDPVYYIVPPQGEHHVFTITLDMQRRSLVTDCVLIICEVYDDGEGNLKVKEITIRRISGLPQN
ncbi:hypothetical protein [Acanthopleuribacter pedis]|uniref:Uncharacterized protein n=1 Tax=Acanthopleuribacter pedis TaxID=442870 RepID=A0A8J7U4X7_9BACT|nr:hypothetical protein [Acanthopleuribacter pedis]MBO1319918.1 hypothetical protein [Acanthopleuribacter pedis]